jgi:hypothetical protein
MNRHILIAIIFTLVGCSSKSRIERSVASELEINEINPNQWTTLTKQNMLKLQKKFDLEPYLYTKKINTQSRIIPHSHPVLTLNTRNAEIPEKNSIHMAP